MKERSKMNWQEQYQEYLKLAPEVDDNKKLRGMHPDIIITDAPPTKWQMFLYKLGLYKRNKEKQRVFKLFESMDRKDTNTDTSAMFNSH